MEEIVMSCPPLTEAEIAQYKASPANADYFNPQNFRVDFTRPPSCIFNAGARKVFVDSFLVSHGSGAYTDKPIPDALLARPIVTYIYNTNMSYRRKLYKEHQKPLPPDDKKLLIKCRAASSRRRTVSKRAPCQWYML